MSGVVSLNTMKGFIFYQKHEFQKSERHQTDSLFLALKFLNDRLLDLEAGGIRKLMKEDIDLLVLIHLYSKIYFSNIKPAT